MNTGFLSVYWNTTCKIKSVEDRDTAIHTGQLRGNSSIYIGLLGMLCTIQSEF